MNPFDDGDRRIAGAPPMPSSIRKLVAERRARTAPAAVAA